MMSTTTIKGVLRLSARTNDYFAFLSLFILSGFLAEPHFAWGSCPQAYSKIVALPDKPALSELNQFLSNQSGPAPHILRISPQGATLTIGVLRREDKHFLGLILRSIREGSLTEIDTGLVVGPKALAVLNRLRKDSSLTPMGRTLRIYGSLSIDDLTPRRPTGAPASARNALTDWSEAELNDFEVAYKELKIAGCDQESNRLFKGPFCHFEMLFKNGKVEYNIEPGFEAN